tara:strand:- start:53 stop:673 length:621 start_codon:yes stop_codon:yes gene_type:complete
MKNNGYGQAEILTPEQLDLLVEHLPEGPHKICICVMRYSASRISETLKLKWSDISNDSLLFKSINTKTDESRSIYLNDKLKLILNEWRLIWHKYPLKARKVSTQNKLIEYVIPQPQPEDYVFKGRKKGTHLNRKSVDRVVRRTLKELSIKGASLHSTRRTCLTTLKNKGWQDADIMAVSGHKDFSSLKKYLHTTPKQMKDMAYDFD